MSTSPEVVAAVFNPLGRPRRAEVPEQAGGQVGGGALAAGYAAGWAQGVAAAAANEREALAAHAATARAERAAMAAALAAALAALEDAAEQMRARLVPDVDATADALVSAAADLAEVLVGHELADGAASGRSGRAALARALAAAPEHADVVVSLHPDDLALVEQLGAGTPAGARTVTLTADPALRAGDALAHFAGGRVDARVGTGLARLRASLRAEPRTAPGPGSASTPVGVA